MSLRLELSRETMVQAATLKAFVRGPGVTYVFQIDIVGGHGDRAQSGVYCGGNRGNRVSLRGEVNAVHDLYMQRTSDDLRSGLSRFFMPYFGMCPSMHACSEAYDRYVLSCPSHCTPRYSPQGHLS